MSKETAKEGYHCARQIHYHIVFPVKYRKALLYREVTKIIVETAEGITERYPIEMKSVQTKIIFTSYAGLILR